MLKIISGIVMFVMLLVLIYGSWLLRRNVNYSYDYEEKVMKTMKEITDPYEKRILELETRVSKLEQQKK